MSGHNKWSTIKRKKEKTDGARAKVFTKIGKEIAMAVRDGGPDPAGNSKLKDVIAKAGLARQNAAAIAPPEQQVPVRQEVAHEVYEYDEDPEDQELEEQKPEETSIKKASLELILKVLDKHGGNRADAAEELGISERTIYRKLKQIKMKK